MRALVVFSFLVISVSLVAVGGEPQRKAFGSESTAGFLVGDYLLVGKKPDSEVTYSGRVVLKQRGDKFDVTRTIYGQTVHGTAFFETATPDKIPVLRMRFLFEGEAYEATYLWQGDLDNYARLTGYVYSSTKNKTKLPGLEVLFPSAH
jgi:hypothetical protein